MTSTHRRAHSPAARPADRSGQRCGFVPPYLLEKLGYDGTLLLDAQVRSQRRETPRGGPRPRPGPAWRVHDAEHGTDLPGRLVRSAGDPRTGEAAVDEAATGITAALSLFAEVYGRDSYDDAGATVTVSVHYSQDYANAFWDGTQLVFGDGDGEVFARFTRSVDVLAHELTHAVTERTAALRYEGQSGALNESVSDVFAACSEQRLRRQSAAEADWLIGSELFLPGVNARGLRDMAAPGTAYDDPRLGKDPQPAHLDGYVETTEDNGGVHLNSGIPNRAFQLAATSVGGSSWEGAGRIWYAALTGSEVSSGSDFAGFAAATIAAAGEHADAVREAWSTVGVEASAPPTAPWPPSTGGSTVRVRRTGGFAGLQVEGEVDLDSDDDRAPALRELMARLDLRRVGGSGPRPDHFTYGIEVPGSRGSIHEQDLTDDLRAVVDLVLRPPTA